MDVTYLWNASPWTLHPHSLGSPGDFSYTCAVNYCMDDRFKKKNKLKSHLCGFAFSVNPVQMERNQKTGLVSIPLATMEVRRWLSLDIKNKAMPMADIVSVRHEASGTLCHPNPCSAFPSHWIVKAWKTSLAKTGGRQLHVRLWKDLYKNPRAGAT